MPCWSRLIAMPTAAVWGGRDSVCSDRGIELQALQVRQYSLTTGPPQSINYTDDTCINSLLREGCILNKINLFTV